MNIMNLMPLIKECRDGMERHLQEHPGEISQDAVIKAGVAAGLRFSNGQMVPRFLEMLCNLETTVYNTYALGRDGRVRC